MGNFERNALPWSADPGSGDLDAVFHALAHPYRRFILEYLGDPGAEATVTELAASIASAHTGVGNGPAVGIDAVESALHHMHLPKLSEAALVEFEPGDCTVTATERTGAVQALLEAAPDL